MLLVFANKHSSAIIIKEIYFVTVKEPCEVPNSIRLTTTWFRNRTIGRLEMCSGNVWGTVCGNGAHRAIAVVACTELNHAANGQLVLRNAGCKMFL